MVDIDKLIWAIEEYKESVKFANQSVKTTDSQEFKSQMDSYKKVKHDKVEVFLNEYIDERINFILKQHGLYKPSQEEMAENLSSKG